MGRKKAIDALVNVTKIRIAREEKALHLVLLELRDMRGEFDRCMQEETAWKESKAGWEREISGASSLLSLSERERASIRKIIDTIDQKLARVIQRRRLLDADLKIMQEQCRLQRQIIFKQNGLKEIFQKRGEKEAWRQLQIAEEEEG
jgi:hypothetical protein